MAELRQKSSVPLDELGQRGVDELLKSQGIDPDLNSPASWARLVEVLEVTDEEALRLVVDRGVPHHVLNARQHENEARIVAQAGRLAAVTIATNMAGRGTDIVLGGNPEPDVEALLDARGIDHSGLSTTLFTNQALKGDPAVAVRLAAAQGGLPAQVLSAIRDIRLAWRDEQKDVLAAGGLHILGTERLESRRIDNQLRGRSGRQGDPGSARFYVSLEDELMRLFGPDRWGILMNQWPEEQPVEARLITKAMGNAQRKVEGRNFEMRKNTLRYDDVMNVQRQHIYGERRRILEGKNIRETVSHILTDMVDDAVARCLPADVEADEWDLSGLWMEVNEQFALCDQVALTALRSLDRETVGERLRTAAEQAYSDKESDFLCAVGQWQLDNDLSDMEVRFADRNELARAVNAVWPLHDYLPARLERVTEHRRRDALQEVGSEAPVAAPRAFLTAVVRDRVQRGARDAAARMAAGEAQETALAECLSEWPLELEAAAIEPAQLEAACLAVLDGAGWRFVERALRRQVEATIDAALEEYCDLEALIGELDALWPLGEDLAAARLAPLTFRAMLDRLQTMATDGLRRQGLGFLRTAAEHRLRRAFERSGGVAAEAEQLIQAVLPPGVRPAIAATADAETAIDQFGEELAEALALAAVEEAAVQAAVAAHRRMAAGGGEEEDEEDLEYGDLRKMIERLNEEWALEDALNPWELERLPPTALRRKMIEEVRGEVRTRGQSFVSAAARRRLVRVVHAAVEEHHSLTALCNRLSREYELAGVFEPKELVEATNPAELIELLGEQAAEAMADDNRKLERFTRNVRRSVDEGISPRKLAERLNKELRPEPPLTVEELHDAVADAPFGGGEEELQSYVVSRLEAAYERFEEQFILEALHDYLRSTIEEAIRRHYNLTALSDRIWSTWPIPRDDVKPTRLAGWSHQDRPNELRARFVEANNKAPRAFLRRFVAKHLEVGLLEAAEVHAPAAARARDWDLPGLCAELAERWPLTEAPEPTQVPTNSHGGLMDALLDLGRRAYRDAEQEFIRDTAWHRFAQRVDHLVAEHYCLQRACQAVNGRWGLDDVVQPELLARVRAVSDGGRERLSAEVGGLIDQMVPSARETFLYESLAHRIESNVYEALWAKYSPERLLQAVAGSWPLPYGSPLSVALSEPVRQNPDEEHGHAVRVREFRRAVSAANGSLQRRLAFFNLCGAMAEVDPHPFYGAPGGWRVPAYVDELRRQLPAGLDRDLDPQGFAVRLMQRTLADSVTAAVGGLLVADTAKVGALVLRRVEAHLDEPHMPRAPRELSFELGKRWPLGDRPDASSLRGQDAAAVRRAFVEAAEAAYRAGPQAFLEEAAARWAARTVHETIDRYFPAHGDAGPWAVAQTCHALNERWNQPELLHPTTYRNLESEALRAALLEVAAGERGAHLTEQFLRELAHADLSDGVGAAAQAALEGGAETWQWPAFAARLQERWIGPAPTVDEVAAKITPELLHSHVLSEAERLEPRVVREYGTTAVGDWLTGRINRALDQFYSLRQACDELSRRWPTASSLYEARLARQYSDEVQNSLLIALFEQAKEGGAEFVAEAARQHLQADLDDLAAALRAGRADLGRVREHLRGNWGVSPDLGAFGALAVDEQAARVAALLPELAEAAYLEAFRRETVRTEIRLSVGRAQYQHCNPEHASDLWDREAFVTAIERDWPVPERLSAAVLQDAYASGLFNQSADVLLAAFTEDEAGFVERTTRHRVLNSLADVVPAHADLDSLCRALAAEWPTRDEFDADELWRGRTAELEETLLELVGGDPEQHRADVEAAMDAAAGRDGQPDTARLVERMAQRWPEAPRLSPPELDERLLRNHLRTQLWAELVRGPLPFVKRERLDEGVRGYEGRLMLYEIDRNWCDHLEAMDYLREGINLRGYGQTDPFIAYRKDGRQMFESMLGRVREGVIQGLFKTTDGQMLASYQRSGLVGFHVLEIQNVREQAAKVEELTAASEPREDGRGRRSNGGGDGRKPVVVGKKVGRNDPCPCGSGRRYKDCCAKRGGVPDAAGR
ncbi:MAG: SEC-C domain-containing protein [Armatimonadetes bacterium]|nr:SEC-C domain-containing protein [Armatimonadota bacterium]